LAFGQQATPVSAADDSLTTSGEEPVQTTGGDGPTAMQADTTTIRHVRHGRDTLKYYMSIGIGSSVNYQPDQFKDNFDPSFGIRIGGGYTRKDLRLGISMSYNFFLSNGPTTIYPDDLNILSIFGELKFIPVGTTVRPYILACGGYWRQWIVNTNYLENVLGYGGGAGIELAVGKGRQLFLEGRYVQGQTRESEMKANTVMIPFTIGVIWMF
jgi:hypothetical protein